MNSFQSSYFSAGRGSGLASRIALRAARAATLKSLSLLNRDLSTISALVTVPSRSSFTKISTLSWLAPLAPTGGVQCFEICERNRSISDTPNGIIDELDGVFSASPTAAVRFWASCLFSAFFFRAQLVCYPLSIIDFSDRFHDRCSMH